MRYMAYINNSEVHPFIIQVKFLFLASKKLFILIQLDRILLSSSRTPLLKIDMSNRNNLEKNKKFFRRWILTSTLILSSIVALNSS